MTETYRDADGKTQTRQVQKVRWEPAAGRVSKFFDDELVAASKGVDPSLLRGIEPFPTKELKPYDPGYVSGWVVEQYQIDLIAAAERARASMQQKVESACAADVPGDTHRNLQVDADYSAQTFKHILVPVWLLSYTYGAKSFPVAVNGYTGAISGRYPKSWVKILFAVLGAVAAAIILMAIAGRMS